jgi:hypothetical protein
MEHKDQKKATKYKRVKGIRRRKWDPVVLFPRLVGWIKL